MEMQPVSCDACGNEVLVHKFSYHQTSVQWRGPASTLCAQFRAASETGRPPTDDGHSCSALRASIERAVLDGSLTVPDDESGAMTAGLGSPAEAAPSRGPESRH